MRDVETKTESGAGTEAVGRPRKKLIAKSIFMAHVRRIGFVRTFFGGFLQYLSVLEFIFLHLTVIIVLYRWMLTPFFALKRFRIKDYLLFDRDKIDRMRAFDKLNCQFCAYANGTAKLWNDELDELARADLGKGRLLAKLVAGLYSICLAVFLVFNFILSKILFFFIALFLGMHWSDASAIGKELAASGYAGSLGFPFRGLVRFAKVYAKSLALNLEQIESSWCPLTHLEAEGAVISEHHANFYGRERLDEVIDVLATEGTVSPRKPKY